MLENEEGTKLSTVYELLQIFKERRNKGHSTESADRAPPPHPATVGWRDLDTGERFYVTIPVLRTDLTDVNRMVFGNAAVDAEPGTDDFVIDLGNEQNPISAFGILHRMLIHTTILCILPLPFKRR